jgi:protein-S-isoprenylcysteine O-methyltransferase Ste14
MPEDWGVFTNNARYWLGVLMIITTPPAIIYWYVVHPFVGFWRRLGKVPSLVILSAGFALMGYGLFLIRDAALVRDLGTNRWLWIPAVLLYLTTLGIELQCRKHLKFGILAGVPEIDPEGSPTPLLKSGIYSRIRHPRYLGVLLGFTAVAFFINYLGVYLLVGVTLPALLIVIWLEEKELADRFGEEYQRYRREVPVLIPRFREPTHD